MYQYNQAIEEYRIAKLQTEELDWVTDEVSYHLLFREICRGYVSAILHKAHHIKIFDLEEANLLMSHALPMMYRCKYFGLFPSLVIPFIPVEPFLKMILFLCDGISLNGDDPWTPQST